MAGSGTLMHGYDLVIAGGISIMNDFLEKFYPTVLRKKKDPNQDNYCKHNNEVFQLFTSSLYLAALTTTIFAATVTRKFGRRTSMLIAGLFFNAGTILGTAAQNLGMLIAGRVLLGCGIGFAKRVVPLYLSEIAPPSLRGRLNLIYAVNFTLGIFSGNIVNYLAAKIHPWGWRHSLGVAGIPAFLLTVGSLLVVETPASLIERGHSAQAKAVLRKIRGTDEVDAEFDDLVDGSQITHEVKHPFRNLLMRQNRPQLVLAFTLPFFQQLSGNDAILFYGPFLFKTTGFQNQAALYSAVITGAAAVVATCVAMFVVDKAGRRILLLAGSIVLFSALVTIGNIFRVGLQGSKQSLARSTGIAEIVILCLFVMAFTCSWGSLSWLIPSEIFPQHIRSAGQSVAVMVNMVLKFLIAQTFLSMLCVFKFGMFFFFAGWVVVMGVFALLLVPETRGVPMDRMGVVWEDHWFWKRVVLETKSTLYKARTDHLTAISEALEIDL